MSDLFKGLPDSLNNTFTCPNCDGDGYVMRDSGPFVCGWCKGNCHLDLDSLIKYNRCHSLDYADITTLFRPVGQKEFDLIRASNWLEFPPRLPGQPIFYPVLTEEYATHIAREWNVKDLFSGNIGYVTRFFVDSAYIRKFEVHRVGMNADEYWIPAEELSEFNQQIIRDITFLNQYLIRGIQVVAVFRAPTPEDLSSRRV